jgi:hypothetical protein
LRPTGKDFRRQATAGFNAEYMRAMYEYGHGRVTAGGFWEKTLNAPGVAAVAQVKR